jgi:hypothetical protein
MTNGNDLLRTEASQHRYDVYLSLFHANYSGYCDSKDHWLYSAALRYTRPPCTNVSLRGLTDSESRTEREVTSTDGLLLHLAEALVDLSQRDSRI